MNDFEEEIPYDPYAEPEVIERGREPSWGEELKGLAGSAYQRWEAKREREEELEEIRERARARRGAERKPSRAREVIRGLLPGKVTRSSLEAYVGGAPKGMYGAPGMRKLTEISPDMPAKEALRPELGRLREKTELKPIPIKDVSELRGRLTLTSMDMGNKPRGWTDIEWMVFKEVADNDDRDTWEHVEEEVAKFGYRRGVIRDAIRKVIKRGAIYEDKSYPGEPILRKVNRG